MWLYWRTNRQYIAARDHAFIQALRGVGFPNAFDDDVKRGEADQSKQIRWGRVAAVAFASATAPAIARSAFAQSFDFRIDGRHLLPRFQIQVQGLFVFLQCDDILARDFRLGWIPFLQPFVRTIVIVAGLFGAMCSHLRSRDREVSDTLEQNRRP